MFIGARARSSRCASSSPTSCCSTSACRRWTATRWRGDIRAQPDLARRAPGRADRLRPGGGPAARARGGLRRPSRQARRDAGAARRAEHGAALTFRTSSRSTRASCAARSDGSDSPRRPPPARRQARRVPIRDVVVIESNRFRTSTRKSKLRALVAELEVHHRRRTPTRRCRPRAAGAVRSSGAEGCRGSLAGSAA